MNYTEEMRCEHPECLEPITFRGLEIVCCPLVPRDTLSFVGPPCVTCKWAKHMRGAGE